MIYFRAGVKASKKSAFKDGVHWFSCQDAMKARLLEVKREVERREGACPEYGGPVSDLGRDVKSSRHTHGIRVYSMGNSPFQRHSSAGREVEDEELGREQPPKRRVRISSAKVCVRCGSTLNAAPSGVSRRAHDLAQTDF